MDRKKKRVSTVRWLAAFMVARLASACAGADGDPAPAAREASAPEVTACDAGTVE